MAPTHKGLSPADAARTAAKAWSFSKRRPTAVQKEGHAHYLYRSRGEKVTFKVESDPSMTAAANWCFDGGVHRIRVGIRFTEDAAPSCRTNVHQMKQYAQSLIRHECAHGLWTDRTNRIPEEAAKRGIPFRLVNLFEDARIEHLARCETGGGDPTEGERFRWKNWTPSPAETDNPCTFFWCLINREASAWSNWRVAAPSWTGAPHTHGSLVPPLYTTTTLVIAHFYKRAIACKDTESLIPVIEDWIKVFPDHPPVDLPRGSAVINGVKDPKAEAGGGGHGFGGGASGEATIVENPEATPGECGVGTTPDVKENRDLSFFNGKEGEAKRVINYQPAKMNAIAQKLMAVAHHAGHSPTTVSVQGSRLHMPGVVAGTGTAFRQTGRDKGKRRMVLICDYSGSMTGLGKASEQYHFMVACMMLHRRGVIHVDIWLTGEGRCARIRPEWSIEHIDKLLPKKGCESVRQTMQHAPVKQDMLNADATVVYTDGQLTDGDVDANEWRCKGVDLIGACTYGATPTDYYRELLRNGMLKHFGRVFLEDTATQLASRIVNHIVRSK